MKLLTHQKPTIIHHKYLVNGMPQNCASCREPLQGEIRRVGNDYFCNELCVDAAAEFRRRLS